MVYDSPEFTRPVALSIKHKKSHWQSKNKSIERTESLIYVEMKPKLTSGRRNVSPMIGADFVFAPSPGTTTTTVANTTRDNHFSTARAEAILSTPCVLSPVHFDPWLSFLGKPHLAMFSAKPSAPGGLSINTGSANSPL